MTFLQPVLLLLGALISVPFIIHLVGEKRYRAFSFSSLKFLREIERDSLQKLKLRQWLILFSRAMWIAMLVLALANPFFSTGSGRLEPGILLIDKSFSTQQNNIYISAAEAFQKEYTKWHVVEYNENSSIDTLKKTLNEYIKNNKLSKPNIILLSDFQDNYMTREVLNMIETSMARCIYVPVYKEENNTAVSRLSIQSDIQNGSRMSTLNIHTSSTQNTFDIPSVYVSINGKRVGRVSISKDGYGAFHFNPGNMEYVRCVVRTSDDDYPDDNTRYLVMKTYQKIRLLCISKNTLSGYHLNAFASMQRIDATIISPDVLPSYNFQNFDMIWLSDLYVLPKGQQESLMRYAETHPLVLSVGATLSDISAWSHIIGKLIPADQQAGFLNVSALDASLQFDGYEPSIFRVRRYYQSSADSLYSLWTLSSGDPLLARHGKHIYIFFSPFQFDWNEIGLSPYFTRALGRFIESVVGNEIPQYNTGDAISISRPQYTVITPAGERHTVQTHFTETRTPGFYTLEAVDIRQDVAVNIPEGETIQLSISLDSIKSFPWNEACFGNIRNTVKGRNIQTLFFILSIIFIMLEMILLRKGEQTE